MLDADIDEQGSKCLMGSEPRPQGSAYPLQARSHFECGEKVGSSEGYVCVPVILGQVPARWEARSFENELAAPPGGHLVLDRSLGAHIGSYLDLSPSLPFGGSLRRTFPIKRRLFWFV